MIGANQALLELCANFSVIRNPTSTYSKWVTDADGGETDEDVVLTVQMENDRGTYISARLSTGDGSCEWSGGFRLLGTSF